METYLEPFIVNHINANLQFIWNSEYFLQGLVALIVIALTVICYHGNQIGLQLHQMRNRERRMKKSKCLKFKH